MYNSQNLSAITPQSVNIDFQTGIAANTLAFANIRWVHWDQFAVTPTLLEASQYSTASRTNLKTLLTIQMINGLQP